MPKVSNDYIQNRKTMIIDSLHEISKTKPIYSITMQELINAFREGKNEILLRKLGDEEADFHYEAGDFSDKRVLLIEWTHAGNPNLKGVDISVFLYSTPEETLERRKKRARNANTDTPLIALVLELEQIMLNENAKNADIIQMMNGQILNAAEYKEMIGDR